MRPDLITLKQLRAVLAVAETGSITAAAQRLALSVPAVHNQIKLLEENTGLPLLRRSADSAGSDLTEAGFIVHDAAQRIAAMLVHMGDDLSAQSRGASGRVVLSVVSTAKYFAPRLVKALSDQMPGIEIALTVGNRERVIADLDRGVADLAIMGRPPRKPVVDAFPLGPHPHGLIAPPDHPLASRSPLTPDELHDQVFLSREVGSGTRILMERYLAELFDRGYAVAVMDSNETIKQAVMAGLGIAFLSLHTVTEELREGRLIQLAAPGLPISRHWFLVRAAADPERPATANLRAAILRMDGHFLPAIQTR
ncbi:MAG: LysR family transcriptional regulator [Paracoccus sp. (in: a-proteobacteria)]|nr:LysR family transcriptional regulator [Paracoccus sp. (in: a-proteobacteria)]